METKVRDWYVNAYPTDDMGRDIKESVTFGGVKECLRDGVDVYGYIGVSDSIVRERIFARLATLWNKPYRYVYDLWLNK